MMALNPWILLGVVLAFAGVGTGAYLKGGADTRNRIEAQAAREVRVHQEAYDAALRGTAQIIVKTEAVHSGIQQKAREIIREVPIYRDCESDPRVSRLLDDARANRASSVTPDPGKLPGGANASEAR